MKKPFFIFYVIAQPIFDEIKVVQVMNNAKFI